MSCAESLAAPKPDAPNVPIVLVAAAALINDQSEVLLAQRPDGKSMAGLWEFPGGKVEQGETPEFALMRELEEELGIESRPTCYHPIAFASHTYDDFHLLMPVFALRVWKGEVIAKEHKALEWVRPLDMPKYDMPKADIPLIATLRDLL